MYGEKTFTNVVQETAGDSTFSYGGLLICLGFRVRCESGSIA